MDRPTPAIGASPVPAVGLLALLVIATVAGGAATRAEPLTLEGPAVAERAHGAIVVWAGLGLTARVAVPHEDRAANSTVCLQTRPPDGGLADEIACEPSGGSGDVVFAFDQWPTAVTGPLRLAATASTDGSRTVVGNASLLVLHRGGDRDGDGLPNERELATGADVEDEDSDDDGLVDGDEVSTFGTSPIDPDTDGDRLVDAVEVSQSGTDPTAPDTDGDGLDDRAEIRVHGTNPTRADSDGDGLADAAEVNSQGTVPTNPDTDGDGLDDGAEVEEFGTNPLEPDTDSDGLNDNLEVNTYGTDPVAAGTDGDGLDDGAEVERYETDPTTADTDGDGLDDGAELRRYGTSPTRTDTDGDGLMDGAEVHTYGTDPTAIDSDGDGRDDGAEVARHPGGVRPADIAAAVLLLAGAVVARQVEFPDVSALRARLPDRPILSSPDPDPGPDTTPVAPAVRSNDEEVLTLLASHDGPMRQSKIVERTGWSKAKVSRVLSEMADDGDIVKIDVGRENVIALPGEEPPGVASPLDR